MMLSSGWIEKHGKIPSGADDDPADAGCAAMHMLGGSGKKQLPDCPRVDGKGAFRISVIVRLSSRARNGMVKIFTLDKLRQSFERIAQMDAHAR